jgi:hypothetical protein
MKKSFSNGNAENDFQISFQSYGVKIGVRAYSGEIVSAVKNDLSIINPSGFEIIDDLQIEHLIEVMPVKNNRIEVFKDGELLTFWEPHRDILPYLQSQLRLTVAEYAESRVFLHAGAVGWKGRAMLFPAKSFSGKSALVAELVKRGALYYSDDFAVLDERGFLHPFHRQISLRGFEEKYKQVDFSVESLGGKASHEPIPLGNVLITKYKEGKKNPEIWKPQILSGGRGIMEILSHTIPIRYNPKFSLEVLNKVSKRAIICKSQRGDSSEFATLLLNFFESKEIK